ncbi:MAG: magnesium transporter [Acidobacteria bacterium]|nr:magnesium transporter [Acidobacteriota bacterium]
MAEQILYMTELIGLGVYDLKRRRVGIVRDAAIVPLVDPARVDRFLVGGSTMSWLSVRHDQIAAISLDGIHLKDEQLTPFHSDEYVLRVGRDLLDQQIIDAQGHKVVRINDVTFDIRQENGSDVLSVLEVDIGIRSIFRRIVQGVVPRRWIRRTQVRIPPHSIRWEFCNILEPDPQRRLRLNISNKLLEDMHPADLAEIVEDLSPENREAIFETIDSEVAAETLSEVDPDIQASILESLETEKAAQIVEEMSPDEAADALAELEEETSNEILEEMHQDEKQEIEELLEFDEGTAGALMNTEFVSMHEAATVADAIGTLKLEQDWMLESLHVIFLTGADGRFAGAVPIAKLFLAAGSTELRKLAAETCTKSMVTDKQDRVVARFDKYNVITMPVVDADGYLAGVITADDIITVLRSK